MQQKQKIKIINAKEMAQLCNFYSVASGTNCFTLESKHCHSNVLEGKRN